jgi:hypothetical protein
MMSGGYFNTLPKEVGEQYAGRWEDYELNALFFDLFGPGWCCETTITGKKRKCEFGRTWADPECTGGLAEALDLYLSGDIDEEDYREQVARFKKKWLDRKTPNNRVSFYLNEFDKAASDIYERMRKELSEI